jgi:hypothetical protein
MRTITLVWACLVINAAAGTWIHLDKGDFLAWIVRAAPLYLAMGLALLIVTHYVLPALRALRRAISRRMPWADA